MISVITTWLIMASALTTRTLSSAITPGVIMTSAIQMRVIMPNVVALPLVTFPKI